MNLSVSPEIVEDFKKNIMVNVNNDLKKAENRDKSEASEQSELAQMIQNGSTLKEMLAKLIANYKMILTNSIAENRKKFPIYKAWKQKRFF